MRTQCIRRQALISWAAVATLIALLAVLGYLQYRWIGEVSRAEGERLRGSLQASLQRLSLDFNAELTSACAALMPRDIPPGEEVPEQLFARLYAQWKETSHHHRLFRAFALASQDDQGITLRRLNFSTGSFETAPWPAEWSALRHRMEAHFEREPRGGRPGPPFFFDDGTLIELRRFQRPPRGGPNRADPPGRGEDWILLDVDPGFVRETLLPELLRRHLGAEGAAEYQAEVVTRSQPPKVIFQTDPTTIGDKADASVALFDVSIEQVFRRVFGNERREGIRGRPPSGEWGRWRLSVRHRAGSVDAVVNAARWRNLTVTGGILLLMLAAVAALLVFTRRAQQLAALQMDFVAGVSHELRTPLTVIRTAAFNLRGKLAHNPVQVEKYGALIQQESDRLGELVEQVLRFAGARAGKVKRIEDPVAIESVIDESLELSRGVIERSRCTVEKNVESGLPLVLGDALALRHAVQNLVANAAKHGSEGSNWIGVSAARRQETGGDWIEIRIADHGPGIPAEERERIFEPFFRGQRALQDQVHGTGLGLSLVKNIVEAHGGTIEVISSPGRGAEFLLRLPVAPAEYQDEFTNTAG